MTTKIISSSPVNPKSININKKIQPNKIYGKPSKPRCQQPSMYQILSWKNDQKQQQKNQAVEVRQTYFTQNNQPLSMKKLIHCKSLPAQNFVKSKNLSNFSNQINAQIISNNPNRVQNQVTKKVNISNHTDYSLNPNKKSQSMKKIINPTNIIQPSNQTNQMVSKKQINHENYQNNYYQDSKENKKLKKKVLQKNKIPVYNDPQNKPRYMKQKKTAVQKLIQSPDFDHQKFQKMKQQQIKRFKQTTRDLSNSAFLTYFNKPPFQNYGRQNKHSSGVLYGDYMYSHNVFPHTGQNKPHCQQTYVTALSRAKSAGNIHPHPPLSRHLQQKLISGYLTLSQIYPKNNSTASIPIKNQTNLQKIPLFNYSRSDDKNYHKYSPYINPNQNEQLFSVDNKYLTKQQIPKYFSNKNQIQGKQITYLKKIEPTKKLV